MALIPRTIAQRSLDTGNVVQYPSGTPVGDAIQRAGSTLQGVAERFKQAKEKKDGFDAALLEDQMLADTQQMELDAERNAPADGSGLHDSVYGEITVGPNGQEQVAKPGAFDKLFENYLSRVPESKREEFAAKRELYRQRGSVRLGTAQYKAQQDYYKLEIQKSQNNVINAISLMDPNDNATFETYRNNVLELIDKSDLPAIERDIAKANWEANAATALGESMIANDPDGAKKLRGLLGFKTEEADGSADGGAVSLLRKFEGFRESTYWDVNAHRVGYGSDTITKENGTIVRVKQGDTVTRADAERDLARRTKEFEHSAADRVGAAWGNLPTNAKAALVSVTYNYGRLPSNVTEAARTGDVEKIASAVEALKGHNGGVNAKRRQEEANIIRGTSGVPSSREVDPRFASMTFEQRQALANRANAAINQRKAEDRAAIDIAVTNAPAAIMSTGGYSEQMPSPEAFISAYGPAEGAERYNNFQASVDTARQAYAMQTMPSDEIQSALAAATPLTSGNDAALAQSRYEALSKAAAATLKAREADPAAYVRQAFPAVKEAWKTPNQPGGFQAAVAASIAAQQHLGITNIQPLPKDVVSTTVDTFKDETLTEAQRIDHVAGIIMATSDPTQQRAIFEQMVEAGLPDMTEGAFVALSRGDKGAANRLFRAALVDPSKLPGKAPATPAQIDGQVQSTLMDENQIGDLYYGLSDGSAENLVRAQRDSKLLNNAVNLRLRNGEELSAAVSGAAKDLYGDVKPVLGDGFNVNAQILLPSNEDETAVLEGLAGVMPQVERALTDALAVPADAPTADSTKAIFDATGKNYIANVLSEGYFRNAGDGFVFIDPFTGTAVPGPDGKAMIFTPDQVEASRPVAPPPMLPTDQPRTLNENVQDELQQQEDRVRQMYEGAQ